MKRSSSNLALFFRNNNTIPTNPIRRNCNNKVITTINDSNNNNVPYFASNDNSSSSCRSSKNEIKRMIPSNNSRRLMSTSLQQQHQQSLPSYMCNTSKSTPFLNNNCNHYYGNSIYMKNHHPYYQQLRWNSNNGTNNKDGGGNSTAKNNETNSNKQSTMENDEIIPTATPPPILEEAATTTTKPKMTNTATTESSSLSNDAAKTSSAMSAQLHASAANLEEKFKAILYDQIGAIVTACLCVLLIMTPYAVQQMKKNDHPSSAVDISHDPIDDFMKLVKHEWDSYAEDDDTDTENTNGSHNNLYYYYKNLMKNGSNKIGDNDDDEKNQTKNLLQAILMDVFSSKGLQDAAQQFVVQIITSNSFKVAITRLVQELWNDLITDPETVKQVIRVLEIAIQDDAIKRAAQQLVIDIVQDEAVKSVLIELIQKLGNDPQVRNAAVELLTESAHITLADPDLLDHSMEFATDVVGDDIVQRTAADALRNTVGHAFVKPVSTVLLTALGVSLVLFGMVSIGYSRSSEQEAVLMEHAARSLKSNTTYGIGRIVSWPMRTIQSLIQYMYHSTVQPTYHSIIYAIINTYRGVYATINNALLHIFVDIPYSVYESIQNSLIYGISSILQIPSKACNQVVHLVCIIGRHTKDSVISFVTSGKDGIYSLFCTVGNNLLSMTSTIEKSLLSFLEHNWIHFIQSYQSMERQLLNWLLQIEIQLVSYLNTNSATTRNKENNNSTAQYYVIQTMKSLFQQTYHRIDETILAIYWNLENIFNEYYWNLNHDKM